jgi:hypothetical protein
VLFAILTWKNRKNRPHLIWFGIAGGIFIAGLWLAFVVWRHGTVVAEAKFNPGIAPFTIEVRRVPVPVTNSKHFIVELYRGQYVVTSFRYFGLTTPLLAFALNGHV